MRSTMLGVCLVLGVLLSCGCDGGGSDTAGSGEISAPITILGNVDVPVAALDSWAASTRAAFGYSKLLVKAYGSTGTVLGEAAVKADKSFSLTLSAPDNEVTLKVTSLQGFELRKLIGPIGASGGFVGTVDSTSTCQHLLQKDYGLATDTSSIPFTTLSTAFVNSMNVAPTFTNGTIVDSLKTAQAANMSAFRASQDTIRNSFSWIEAAMKAKFLSEAAKYFSPSFTSSDASLASTVTLDNFKTTTQDRFNRFTIDLYSYTIEKTIFTDATTAVVYGNARISVTGLNDGVKQSAYLSNQKVVWRMENGSWVVFKDFPYLTSQLGFSAR